MGKVPTRPGTSCSCQAKLKQLPDMSSEKRTNELKLAEKIGKVLYIAVTENKYNRYDLIHKWLTSDTYDKTVNFYVHLCSQTKTYIFAAFEREFENDLPSIDEGSPLYLDFITSCKYEDCCRALKRIQPRIDMKEIYEIIDAVPMLTKERKLFLREVIKARSEIIINHYCI